MGLERATSAQDLLSLRAHNEHRKVGMRGGVIAEGDPGSTHLGRVGPAQIQLRSFRWTPNARGMGYQVEHVTASVSRRESARAGHDEADRRIELHAYELRRGSSGRFASYVEQP